jgi:hypothetical protein
MLPSGRSFRLVSDIALPPSDASTISPPARDGGVVFLNGGGNLFLVGIHFTVSDTHASTMLSMPPPIVHIRKNRTEPRSGCAALWNG